MIGHFTDDEKVLEYINSNDLERLAPMGTSCPDHFLRTKIKPLILNLTPEQDLSDKQMVLDKFLIHLNSIVMIIVSIIIPVSTKIALL